MNINRFLQIHNARVSYEDKWLVWYENQWVVFCRPYGAKKNRTLYQGQDIDEALKSIISERV